MRLVAARTPGAGAASVLGVRGFRLAIRPHSCRASDGARGKRAALPRAAPLRYCTFRSDSPRGPPAPSAREATGCTSDRLRWDLEVDVVAVGSGLGAIGAAIAAHDRGSRVVGAREGAAGSAASAATAAARSSSPTTTRCASSGSPIRTTPAAATSSSSSAGFADPALQKQAARHDARRDRVLRARGRRALDRRRGTARLLLPRRARLARGRALPVGRALPRRRARRVADEDLSDDAARAARRAAPRAVCLGRARERHALGLRAGGQATLRGPCAASGPA